MLLHNIEVPMNVGSLFRIADSFALEHLYLSGRTIRPPNRKLRKTSRSTEQTVNHSSIDSPIELINSLKSEGYRVVSLELTNYSVDIRLFKCDRSDKLLIIPGAEKSGVAAELLALSDECVHIPMRGKNSSMNVAAACSIALYEFSGRLG